MDEETIREAVKKFFIHLGIDIDADTVKGFTISRDAKPVGADEAGWVIWEADKVVRVSFSAKVN